MSKSIQPAFKRLFDAQSHWHNANKEYFNPSSFRIAINSCIQELRNVTFVLQSNKRGIEGFDSWYEPWQEKMRANNSLRWLVAARNYIVKQGDLELKSILRIEVIGTYVEKEVSIFEQDYDPKLTDSEIFKKIIESGLPKEVLENSYIKLERKWVDQNYSRHELLKLIGICWTAVLELLLDAPTPEFKEQKEQLQSAKIPPCMYQGSETHSIWMKVLKDELVPSTIHEKKIDIEDTNVDEIKQRYSESPMLSQEKKPSNFKETCELFFEQAKYVLRTDGHHVHLVAIFVDSKLVELKELINDDQADKFRTMRLIASEIEKIGANQFLMVSEAWSAPFDPAYPHRHASESPDKTEALHLVGASKDGEGYLFSVPFININGNVELSEPELSGIDGVNIIKPILSVWGLA
jgi:hypothetical protein